MEAGERLLWVGRAGPGLIVARALGFVLLSLLGLLWISLRTSAAGVPGDPTAVSELFGRMVRDNPLAVAIGALVLLASPVFAYLRYGRTRYAITYRRLVAWRGGGTCAGRCRRTWS